MIPHTENLPLAAFLHTMVYKKTAIPAILSSDITAFYYKSRLVQAQPVKSYF